MGVAGFTRGHVTDDSTSPQLRDPGAADGGRQAPDLVERNFTAQAPDRLWVADITYIPTWAGFLYLAVVLDAYSRRIVGWSMATTPAKQLVLDALNMALATRRPRQVIHHSDQGSQYTSIEFGRRCRDAGMRPSMGSVGDAYDNAMCESFFATLECELLARSRFKTQAEARHAIFELVEGFYNRRRRHSSIGYLSPVDYERRHPATRSIPTHTSLPSCSRPSRTSPPGGPKKGPSLTAAVRDGRTIVRAGTENGSARSRTKECLETEPQYAVRSDSMIPSSHPSTKPGQVHTTATRSPT